MTFPPGALSADVIAAAVHRDLDSALNTIPAGQHGALLLHVDLESGKPTGGFTVAEKVGDNWAVAFDGSVGQSNGHLDPAVGLAVKGSW